MDEVIEDFMYKIITKNDLVIVAFKGVMNKNAKDQLETCLQELSSFESKIVVLLFKEVPTVEISVLRELSFIQHETRKKNKLFLVDLRSRLKQFLYDKGVIRLVEIKPSLEHILNEISQTQK